jgi:GNAT superfamily N-acetyltransferase
VSRTTAPPTALSREHIIRAREERRLAFRLLEEEGQRAQVEGIHKASFGEWQDQFDSLEKCGGRALLCELDGLVLGYQSFDPEPAAGNPFPGERAMRFIFIMVRDDAAAAARGLGLARELVKRSLELAWERGYSVVYTFGEAYELLEGCGFVPRGGRAVLYDAKVARDMDPDEVTPVLFFAARPPGT